MGAVPLWKSRNDRSTEGTRSLDWHLHKLFVHIVWRNLLQRTSMRNVPSQPCSGPRVSPFVCHIQWDSNTKKHFSNSYKACLTLRTKHCSAASCLEWIADSYWHPQAIKHLPPPLQIKKNLKRKEEALTFGHFVALPRAVWEARQCICWRPCTPVRKTRDGFMCESSQKTFITNIIKWTKLQQLYSKECA